MKGLLSQCERQKAFAQIACHLGLLSADNCTVNESLPAQTKHRALENMKVTTTVLKLNQMIVMMGCEWESRK